MNDEPQATTMQNPSESYMLHQQSHPSQSRIGDYTPIVVSRLKDNNNLTHYSKHFNQTNPDSWKHATYKSNHALKGIYSGHDKISDF